MGSWSSSYTMMTVGTMMVGSVATPRGSLLVSAAAEETTGCFVIMASITPVSRPLTLSTTSESSSDFCSTVSDTIESPNSFSWLLSSWAAISPTATFSWLLSPALMSGARSSSTILRGILLRADGLEIKLTTHLSISSEYSSFPYSYLLFKMWPKLQNYMVTTQV